MSHIFLSYAREDRDRAKPFVAALEQRGWTVWWDPTILAGQSWQEVIDTALEAAHCVVVLWSKHSVKKHWVLTEANEGFQRGILVPVLIDEVRIPLAFRLIQAENLIGWLHGQPSPEFDRFVQAIARLFPVPVISVAQEAAQPVSKPAVTTRVNPKDGLAYVWIPPGKFMMGCSPGDEECYDNEKPPREVVIEKGYWLGETPVTQAAWKRVMGTEPSLFTGENRPVERVSMEEAKKYCAAVGRRLPTEAEWEYAARAGSKEARYGDLDKIAWHRGNSGRETHEVKQKEPNAWGLYDMLGNVYEWVEGDYNLRGGSWLDNPRSVRASVRYRDGPGSRDLDIGFRCGGEVSL